MTRRYVIDGSKIANSGDFYREIGEAVNGPGGHFGDNLDSLADCLLGGMGTPDDQDFSFTWRNSTHSQKTLGHDETARVLRSSLSHVHPANVASVQARIDDADHHIGPTLFDAIIDVFRERDVHLDLE